MSEVEMLVRIIFTVLLPVGLFSLAIISFIIGTFLKFIKSTKHDFFMKIGTICFTISMIIYFLCIVIGFILV
jgi:hypothetical protein